MTYKELLLKINTLPDDIQAAARKKALQGKIDKIPAASVWDMLKNTDQEKITVKNDTKQNDHVEISPAASVPEIVNGEAVRDDDYINGLYLPDIENKVNECLECFLSEINIDDPAKMTQRQFQAFAMYTGKKLFKGTKLLKDTGLYDNGSAMPTNCHRYDLQKVVAVLNLFVYICTKYNKAFTLDGGAYFCGLSDNFITENKEKLTLLGFDPTKKAENTIAAGLLDGKINPTGCIAWLNYNAKWAQPSQNTAPASVNVAVYPVLNAAAVPSLPDNDKM